MLLAELGDIHLPVLSANDAAKVGSRFVAYSNLWDSLQPPALKTDRERWRFRDRKHIPSINYLIQHINNKLGLQRYNKCFPLPGKSCLSKLDHYIAELDSMLCGQATPKPRKQPKKQAMMTQYFLKLPGTSTPDNSPPIVYPDSQNDCRPINSNNSNGYVLGEISQLQDLPENVLQLLGDITGVDSSDEIDVAGQWESVLRRFAQDDDASLCGVDQYLQGFSPELGDSDSSFQLAIPDMDRQWQESC